MAQSISKSQGREKKRFQKKNGMRVTGASVKLLQAIILKKAGK